MKIRKTGRFLIITALTFLLSGCGVIDSAKETVRQVLEEKQAEIYGEQFEPVEEGAVEAAQDTLSVMDYAFSSLNPEEQEFYLELLGILISHQEEVKLSSMDPDLVDRIYQAIMMDHPELFGLEGYTITKHSIADKTVFYTFTGQYNRTLEEEDVLKGQIDQKVKQILSGISEEASDYEKMKFVYEYIVRNTAYDEASEDNQNIVSVFIHQTSVCQGYAYATQYLLKELGIPCTTVTGTARNNAGKEVTHAWNLVQLDGEYYYVDTTWGDPVAGSEMGEAELSNDDYVNYDYLNLTTEEISRDHTMIAPVVLPECTSTALNYYRVEGLFYESYDRNLVKERWNQAKESGEKVLTMKFPDEAVYQEHIDRLFEGQEIFQIEPGLKKVSYTADPESYLLLLYLEDN